MKLCYIALLACVLALSGCTSSGDSGIGAEDPAIVEDWRTFTLTDINGKEIRILDIDTPILIETFAVWCSNCRRQQEQMTLLHEQIGDAVFTIAIDIDPNEDAQTVREHVEKNGFVSHYVVPPREYTAVLVDEFGAAITSPPTVPMILVCNGEAILLERGVKDVETLKTYLESCNV